MLIDSSLAPCNEGILGNPSSLDPFQAPARQTFRDFIGNNWQLGISAPSKKTCHRSGSCMSTRIIPYHLSKSIDESTKLRILCMILHGFERVEIHHCNHFYNLTASICNLNKPHHPFGSLTSELSLATTMQVSSESLCMFNLGCKVMGFHLRCFLTSGNYLTMHLNA